MMKHLLSRAELIVNEKEEEEGEEKRPGVKNEGKHQKDPTVCVIRSLTTEGEIVNARTRR